MGVVDAFLLLPLSQQVLTVGLALFSLLYWKNLPCMFHIRFAMQVILGLLCRRQLKTAGQAVKMSDRVLLCDFDFNFHMNNACYYSLLDFARLKWILAFVPKYVSYGQDLKIANGGVSLYFLKELTLFTVSEGPCKLGERNDRSGSRGSGGVQVGVLFASLVVSPCHPPPLRPLSAALRCAHPAGGL